MVLEKEKTYFKGLNGLRAIAALGVVISHVASIQTYFHHYAVIIFFTLSGFLITYLLLAEKDRTATIDLKKFYARRILRIWPLYFFYILLVFFIHTYLIGDRVINADYLGYFLVFFQNIPITYLRKSPTDMSHLWSIGIEEQFYLFWPLVLTFIKNKKRFLIIFIIAALIIQAIVKVYTIKTGDISLFYFLSSFRFDCMAIGALFATLYFEKNTILLHQTNSMWIPIAFWISVLFASIYKFNLFPIYSDEIGSLITAAFIVNQVTNTKKRSVLENKPMIFIGKISYGIYIYHILMCSLLLHIFKIYGIHPYFKLLIPAVLILTILVSYLSYELLEKPFLKIKAKYAVVR